jgi:GMP synthase (glutamine-hydrolysing)
MTTKPSTGQQEKVVVLDFGGQYKQLIARRVRECQVYCEIHSYKTPIEKLKAMAPKGIILTGGPNSVFDKTSPTYEKALYALGIPILGICYGSQLMAYTLGGQVEKAPVSEYGRTDLAVDDSASLLMQDVETDTVCWMSHTDYIAAVPDGFKITAHTPHCPVAAMENPAQKLYAVQFHPEVVHTPEGKKILRNFLMNVCGCSGDWQMNTFVKDTVAALREKIGKDRVLLGLSGGVDSTVTAVLLSRAIGKQLTCVFVDHGLMRKDEGDEVEAVFGPKGDFDLNFIRVNAGETYFEKLKGVTDPEQKRKIIGALFVEIFGAEAKKLANEGGFKYMAQGTIYPDVVESGAGNGGAVIKSHHNVGGLPKEMVTELGFDETPIEPLRDLFKDEVRKVGLELGIPKHLVYRQPFPGPGLGIRVVGEVTPKKVKITQEADAIYREELEKAGIDMGKGQFFAALSNLRSVGVMGDDRTYDYAVVLRGVITSDFMTAEAADIPWPVLQTCMNRIINEVEGVNRVMYDLTSKPPGTIELE